MLKGINMSLMKKKLLVVDDSEIDREILKNILADYFEIEEAENGYAALERIMKKSPLPDAMLLDIQMPVIDGFNVLRILSENNITGIPIMLITAEATKENVQKAAAFGITAFISKPFDGEWILNRLREMFDIPLAEHEEHEEEEGFSDPQILTDKDIAETNTYIAKLASVYKIYLKNMDMSDEHYARTAEITELLLNEYAFLSGNRDLDVPHVQIISRAAYFYDIGHMGIPDRLVYGDMTIPDDNELYKTHGLIGASIVSVNNSKECRYFVQVCSDMCMHHHEKYDGTGYPHGLKGPENSVFTQICRIAEKFDDMAYSRMTGESTVDSKMFDYVYEAIERETGSVSLEIMGTLRRTRAAIVDYYRKYIKNRKV